MSKLLVVIDYQRDFVDGALGFAGADALEPGILAAVESTLAEGGRVLFTRDCHEPDYLETREGTHLPVAHCIGGSAGHELYGGLHQYETSRVPGTLVADKPTFGCPGIAGLAEELCGGAPDVVEICGVVTDICVLANAVLLHTGFPLAQVRILAGLCASNVPENHQKALDLLGGMGMDIVH